MNTKIDHLILAGVLTDNEFAKKYLPYLRAAYFSSVAGAGILLDVARQLIV